MLGHVQMQHFFMLFQAYIFTKFRWKLNTKYSYLLSRYIFWNELLCYAIVFGLHVWIIMRKDK